MILTSNNRKIQYKNLNIFQRKFENNLKKNPVKPNMRVNATPNYKNIKKMYT